mmetsp:Transcript_10986/g.19216  ORF Transcript_10986/g.19216 Transcript_10986/m.19216 type:complete len:202 (-) Transcript_10986:514-1119(-)|eukprot:CAMPEP_0196653624 /NCGR_PEP_ID=MMETSP1086-20130531/3272_1 /TAXON_ID=77921 /ORGANISM="Cyanoptyche  gloeocystis , Strain SAG4.97" /LENGTH=201 /DNA_ID=CAMNT_0041984919 /DNA_START=65 /DNA_END=670 /DNA_ORIENTATION=-
MPFHKGAFIDLDWSLRDQLGNEVCLKPLVGKKNICLFVFPQVGTKKYDVLKDPGDSIDVSSKKIPKKAGKELVELFRNCYRLFRETNTEVIGISVDPQDVLAEFAKEHTVPFALLSDPNWEVVTRLRCRPTLGWAQRSIAYVIDLEGKIELSYESLSGRPKEFSMLVPNAIKTSRDLDAKQPRPFNEEPNSSKRMFGWLSL